MQSDAPQGDPRLQRTDRGHLTVAVRCVEPCIIYLETTLPGEIPLIGACWAKNSHEVRRIGRPAYLALQNVAVFRNQPNHKTLWAFSREQASSMYLIHGPSHFQQARLSYYPNRFEHATDPVFQWAIRHFDNQTFSALRKIDSDSSAGPNDLIAAIFRYANLDWPSVGDALDYLEKSQARTKPTRRRSLVHRVLSSILRKKNQPVHA